MTDATTTADKLAAGELLQAHAPCLLREDGIWICSDGRRGTGDTWYAAVRAWAEAAGVPWPSVKVVQRWAFLIDGLPGDAYQTKEYAVVIRETEGA